MSQPFVGEITIFAGEKIPQNWARCDGTLLEIAQHQALFSLIGTTYGGNGQTTFALPDLRGRIPINYGKGVGLSEYALGAQGGNETTTLTQSEMPAHNHSFHASEKVGSTTNPAGMVLAQSPAWNIYRGNVPGDNMSTSAIVPEGEGQCHNNMMPFQCVNFIIALAGVFPTLHSANL